MAAETGFLIDANMYEIPSIDTFNLDEAQILYDYCGLTIEDFDEIDEGDPKFKNPGFIRALMHIAFQRGNPTISTARVETLVGSANLLSTYEQLVEANAAALAEAEQEEADALPPASTSEPDESSQPDSLEKPSTTGSSDEKPGSPSESDSGAQVVPLAPTTAGDSQRSESMPQTLVH